MADPAPTRRVLFWNVNRRDLTPLIVSLAGSKAADIVVLNEPPPAGADTLAALRGNVSDKFYEPAAQPGGRFRCYARDAGLDLTEVHDGSRTSVRRLRLGGDNLLLAFVHGIDPRNHDPAARQEFAHELASELRFAADQQGTGRLLIVGDFNMNPYDRGMDLASGLNARMTRRCVKSRIRSGTRRLRGRDFDLFYNPMWGLFGDNTPGPAGTIYDQSSQGPYGWSMFDQVLVHHSLVRRFRRVRILTKGAGTPLATADGRPDKDRASNHFPILVTLPSRIPMSDFWPDDLELEDTSSPREILEEARAEWEERSGGRLTLVFQDLGAQPDGESERTVVHAKDVPTRRTAELFTVVHQRDSPYPAALEPRRQDLPNVLRRRYYVPGEDDDEPDFYRGYWKDNESVAESPGEFRTKLREVLNMGATKSRVISLAATRPPAAGTEEAAGTAAPATTS